MNIYTLIKSLTSSLLIIGFCSAQASESYSQRKDVQQFVDEMHQKHEFDRQHLLGLLGGVVQQKTALEAISRPAEGVLTWGKYRKIFMTEKRIKNGVAFWKENVQLLNRAEKEFGVPAEYIVAIIGVETFYGKRAGNYPVLDALTSLGFDYPLENTTQERRDRRERFFRKELKHFLLMSREEKFDPRELKGSYAGAMGMPQFIPSSFRSYAVDFDNNGVRDFWNGSADSIGSVANYFKRHGWQKGQPVISQASLQASAIRDETLGSKKMKPHTSIRDYKKRGVKSANWLADNHKASLLKLQGDQDYEYWLAMHNFYVITRYNHSPLYALAVHQLSQAVSAEYREQSLTGIQ